MGFGSTSNPYNGPEGVNDHNDLMVKGVKTHDQLDVDTDIHGATLKTSPVADDEVMIEDSEASFVKKKIKASTLIGSGVTDHGELMGLGDDDHSQYHNDTRGDARYTPIAHGGMTASVHNFDGSGNAPPQAHTATLITSGTLDGDRLPALSTTKRGGVPATGTPSGKVLSDGDTWIPQSGGVSEAFVFFLGGG